MPDGRCPIGGINLTRWRAGAGKSERKLATPERKPANLSGSWWARSEAKRKLAISERMLANPKRMLTDLSGNWAQTPDQKIANPSGSWQFGSESEQKLADPIGSWLA